MKFSTFSQLFQLESDMLVIARQHLESANTASDVAYAIAERNFKALDAAIKTLDVIALDSDTVEQFHTQLETTIAHIRYTAHMKPSVNLFDFSMYIHYLEQFA